VFENIVRWAPFSRFAEQHNRRAAKLENGFFLAALKGGLTRVDLDNTTDRHCAYFNKRQPSEIFRFKNVYLPLIAEQNIRLILQSVPVDRPQATPEPSGVQGRAVVGVMHMVVIHRRQTSEQYGAADEWSRAGFIAENFPGAEGVFLDGELLVGFQLFQPKYRASAKAAISFDAATNVRAPGRNSRSKNSANER
jgi:hypothetical protein